jgi:Zn-dependent protease/CBS domain-containing protein
LNPSIKLGSLFGIPIGVTWGWFAMFAIVFLTAAELFFPSRQVLPGWDRPSYWGLALLSSLLFFISLIAHELGHSLLARRYGLPVRSITLFFLGGVSSIGADAKSPLSEGLIAVIGPLISLVLGGIFLLAADLAVDQNQAMWALLSYVGSFNLILAAFNMIPGFPLDGGRVVRSIAWGITGSEHRATVFAAWGGRLVGWGFIGLGLASLVLGTRILGPLNGLLFMVLGWFLAGAAGTALQQQRVRRRLLGHTAGDLLAHLPLVSPADTLKDAAELVIHTGATHLLVGDPENPLGVLPAERARGDGFVWGAMTRLSELPVVRADESGGGLVEALSETSARAVVVMGANGERLGIVTETQLRRALEQAQP